MRRKIFTPPKKVQTKAQSKVEPKSVPKAEPKAVSVNFWIGHGEPATQGAINQNFTLGGDENLEWSTTKSGYTGGCTFDIKARVGNAEKLTWVIRIKTDCDNYDKSKTVPTDEDASFTIKTNGTSDTNATIYVYGTDTSKQKNMPAQLHIEYRND